MGPTAHTFLTAAQAGSQLGLTTGALAQMRYTGKGPKFVKLGGRSIRYRQLDIDEWVESCVKTRTDDHPVTSANRQRATA